MQRGFVLHDAQSRQVSAGQLFETGPWRSGCLPKICSLECLVRTNSRTGHSFAVLPAIFVLGWVFVFTGCHKTAAPDLFSNDSDQHVAETSRNLELDFYIDASRSMLGFRSELANGQVNHFTDVLEKADGILREAWPMATIRYWRFGEGQPREVVLRASRENGFFNCNTTHIDTAIQHETTPANGQSQLKIILTDLFQDENDVGLLATQLDTRYLQNEDYAAGILGIRNSFSGNVTDLPGTVPRGGTDSLPFYLLIAGPVEDVQHAMERISNRIGMGSSSTNRLDVVFARRLIPNLQQWLTVSALKSPPGFSISRSMIPGAGDRGIGQVGVYRRSVSLNQNMYMAKDNVDRLEPPALGLVTKLKSTVRMWRASTRKWELAPESIATLFQIKDSRLMFDNPVQGPAGDRVPENQLLVGKGVLTIDARSLPKSSYYLLQYEVMAEEDQVPELKAWNLERLEARQAVQNHQFERTKDGSRPGRTPNLRFFMQTIADRTFQSPIVIARYYLYVRVL